MKKVTFGEINGFSRKREPVFVYTHTVSCRPSETREADEAIRAPGRLLRLARFKRIERSWQVIENNPTNVSSAFEMLLEEVEAEIDFVNNVGSKAFEARDYDKAKEALERAGVLTSFRDRVAGFRISMPSKGYDVSVRICCALWFNPARVVSEWVKIVGGP